jgi:hypothetical protein
MACIDAKGMRILIDFLETDGRWHRDFDTLCHE